MAGKPGNRSECDCTYKLQQLTVNCLPTLDLAARRAEAAAREANIVPGYAVLSSTLQKQNMMMPFKRSSELWGCGDGAVALCGGRAPPPAVAHVWATGGHSHICTIILFICTRKLRLGVIFRCVSSIALLLALFLEDTIGLMTASRETERTVELFRRSQRTGRKDLHVQRFWCPRSKYCSRFAPAFRSFS